MPSPAHIHPPSRCAATGERIEEEVHAMDIAIHVLPIPLFRFCFSFHLLSLFHICPCSLPYSIYSSYRLNPALASQPRAGATARARGTRRCASITPSPLVLQQRPPL